MRKVTVDEAVEQIRELIEWVDTETAYHEVLIVRDGRAIAELKSAEDFWSLIPVLPDSAADQGGSDEATEDSERSR